MKQKNTLETANVDMESVPTAPDTPAVQRDIEIITAEIQDYKTKIGESIYEIGKRLIEAKAQLVHGDWLNWLEVRVEFSEVTAQRFMRIARKYSNPSTVTDLGLSKALSLLALPESERTEFIKNTHIVNGIKMSVEQMNNRQLRNVIRAHKGIKPKTKESSSDTFPAYRKKSAVAKQKSEASSEQPCDFKEKIENVQTSIEDVLVNLEKMETDDDIDEYYLSLSMVCENILRATPPNYTIQMCIKRVSNYIMEYPCEASDSDISKLCDLSDNIVKFIKASESTATLQG